MFRNYDPTSVAPAQVVFLRSHWRGIHLHFPTAVILMGPLPDDQSLMEVRPRFQKNKVARPVPAEGDEAKGSEAGFLLGEALIALSVLVIGLFAVTDAFVTAQRTQDREERRLLLASCAQEQLISAATQISTGQNACSSFLWTEERTPFSPLLDRTVIKAGWKGEDPREALFETVLVQ